MFGSTGLYMFTFVGKALWYAGFGTNAYWNQANPNFPGAWPIRDMTDYVNDVVVVDGNGVLWYIGLPGAGEWVQGYFPQPPFPFKQFMGSGDNGDPGNIINYIAARDTAGRAWIIGNPTEGGVWETVPGLNMGPTCLLERYRLSRASSPLR